MRLPGQPGDHHVIKMEPRVIDYHVIDSDLCRLNHVISQHVPYLLLYSIINTRDCKRVLEIIGNY